jgi:hypothetical protein
MTSDYMLQIRSIEIDLKTRINNREIDIIWLTERRKIDDSEKISASLLDAYIKLAIDKKELESLPSTAPIGKSILSNDKRISTFNNGALHSFDDNPADVQYQHNHIELYWYKNGILHRDVGYAEHLKSRSIECMKWYQNGEVKRDDDLPTCIEILPDDPIRRETWGPRNGMKYTRPGDLPTSIHYFKDGTKKTYIAM